MQKEFKANSRSLGRPRVFFGEFRAGNSAHCADSLGMTQAWVCALKCVRSGFPIPGGMTSYAAGF